MNDASVFEALRGPINRFEDLKGRTVSSIVFIKDGEETDMWKYADDVRLYLYPGCYMRMYHDQECCENVAVEDIVGDLRDLIGEPILFVEEKCSDVSDGDIEGDSGTWTFYTLGTRLGYVDIRWLGTSNGYYSESVTVEIVDDSKKEIE